MASKTIAQKLVSAITDPKLRLSYLTELGLTRWLPDRIYIPMEYKAYTGKKLELDAPKTYNEKIQWLKLHQRDPLLTQLVDKAAVKSYVSQRIGDEYIIPTLGVWRHFDEIDFDRLPDQFVLKCTHDSGGLVICKDKRSFERQAAKAKIEHCLRRRYYTIHREWPYKNVVPQIIAEPYIEDAETGELRDYKIFTFNGRARAFYIATGRQRAGMEPTFDFFDMDYNHLPFSNGHPNAEVLPERPSRLDDMKALAEKLGQGFTHVRVDFYEANGRVYFGEMTFSHMSGLSPFEPACWDETFGSWLELPAKK